MVLALVLFALSMLVSVVSLSLSGRWQAEKVILFLVASIAAAASSMIAIFSTLNKPVQIDMMASAFFSAFALYSIYLFIDSLRDI